MRFVLFLFFAASFYAHAQVPDAKPKADAPKPDKPAEPVNGSASGATSAQAPRPLGLAGENLSASSNYPMQYLLFVAEAMKSFQARDFGAAISYADRADALLEKPSVWTKNVRGAVAIEQLKFEEGKKLCMEALALDPEFFPAKFNLCEIPFLQKRYADARHGWLLLYERMPKDDPTTELLVYRIYLTYLLENDTVHARDWLEKIPFPSQTPAYQYAHAAWERHQGNMKKWEEWIQSAEFIWPRVKRANFVDVLVQLKWLQPEDFSFR